MAQNEKQILSVFVVVLFALWSLYVVLFYRQVETMSPVLQTATNESARFLLFAGIPLWWAFHTTEQPTTSLGLKPSWNALAFGLVIGLVYATIVVVIGVFMQGRVFHPRFADASFWGSGFCFATVVEEISFRSFFIGLLHFRSLTLAVVSSSACFALIHIPGWCCLHTVTSGAVLATQLASIFLLGCVLAIVFRHTRSLYAVIIIHALNNVAAAALQPAD